jgi:Flp pilus assembly pilin Flp
LWKADALRDFDPYPMVQSAAAFLIRQGPVTQQERWEEASGYSPSTLAATIAALICAADFANSRGHEETSRFLEDYADFLVCERKMRSNLPLNLWKDEEGQDIAEYAVMLAVILVLVVGTIRLVGTNANNAFSSVASTIQ